MSRVGPGFDVMADDALARLFMAARMNPQHPMNQPGKLTGRHCQMRLQRAQKRRAKGRRKCRPNGKAVHVRVGRGPFAPM